MEKAVEIEVTTTERQGLESLSIISREWTDYKKRVDDLFSSFFDLNVQASIYQQHF